MIVSHEQSCNPEVRGFDACRGCYLYCSPAGGCTADHCWIACAAPHGKGAGRGRQPFVPWHKEFFPLPRSKRGRQPLVNQDVFLELYSKGLSDHQIADELSVSSQAVHRLRNRMCLPPNVSTGRKRKKAAPGAGTPEGGKGQSSSPL